MSKIILPKPTNLIVPKRTIFIPRSKPRAYQLGFMRLMPSLGLSSKSFSVDAVDFNGTSDKAQRNGGLTGAVSSKLFTLSVWLRIDGGDGAAFRNIFSSTPTNGSPDADFYLALNSSNKFELYGENEASGPLPVLSVSSGTTFTASGTWLHLLTSVDMANAAASFIYVNDADTAAAAARFSNELIDFVSADWLVGLQDDGTFGFPGCYADLWFAPGVFMNVSVEANRRKFRSADGKPVPLGRNGERPTGTPPLVYFHLDAGEPTASFIINRGTGGDFTSGALARASTNPGG